MLIDATGAEVLIARTEPEALGDRLYAAGSALHVRAICISNLLITGPGTAGRKLATTLVSDTLSAGNSADVCLPASRQPASKSDATRARGAPADMSR